MRKQARVSADLSRMSRTDRLIAIVDNALRTVFAGSSSSRPFPGESLSDSELRPHERRASARLMRVNHSGEVSAQALYQGQLVTARSLRVRTLLTRAALEESDHLAWMERRLSELGGRKSMLNPAWYVGSLMIGAVSGLLGDARNLGFLAETERQVARHLGRHLAQLPANDRRSRAILEQMKIDESSHATAAERGGSRELAGLIKGGMQLGSKLMTTSSFWL